MKVYRLNNHLNNCMSRRRNQETTTGSDKKPKIHTNIIRNSSVAERFEVCFGESAFWGGDSDFTVGLEGVFEDDLPLLLDDPLDDPVLSLKLYGQSKVPSPSLS